ncbi:MAG: glutathione S-transferase [Pseudomonadales bacterium]|nr:glutathione S-transferase [Pseudomonadales bacterium]
MLPILYSFRRCPYAMRARLALLYCGCKVELREVILRDKPTQLLAASPKATVPVLVLPCGEVIDESFDVMCWAIASSESCELSVSDEALLLIKNCDEQFKPLLDNYKYFQRHPELSQQQHRDRAVCFLQDWNRRLSQQTYLLGDVLSLADLAIFPFVRQFAHVDKDWFFANELIHLQTWLQRCLESALFTAVMFKYTQWQEGDRAILF